MANHRFPDLVPTHAGDEEPDAIQLFSVEQGDLDAVARAWKEFRRARTMGYTAEHDEMHNDLSGLAELVVNRCNLILAVDNAGNDETEDQLIREIAGFSISMLILQSRQRGNR
jgi:hypothetical protein